MFETRGARSAGGAPARRTALRDAYHAIVAIVTDTPAFAPLSLLSCGFSGEEHQLRADMALPGEPLSMNFANIACPRELYRPMRSWPV